MPEVIERKIVVEVGYYDFHFDDLIAANAFAAVAKSHLSDGCKDREVKITVSYDFKEEEAEDDQTTN